MSGSPHSSLSTPIPPRAPPSPPESVASSTGPLNPNAGDFVPSFLPDSQPDAHAPSSPSSVSAQSSPGSSSTSTSVSFTIAPVSQSLSSFASFASTPSLSEFTSSTTQSSLSSYHSPMGSPNQTPHVAKRIDPLEDVESDSNLSDDVGRRLLRSLRLGSPSTSASTTDLESGDVARTSPPVTSSAVLPSSPEVMPPGPSKKATYVPLPDIEIHKAAPSSFMTPPMEFASAPTSEASEDVVDDAHKTPNVYINGLPPNFPEDQLFELAVPFGEVKSVRSFTRHVGEKESGYGFVLFETIESAEKCIQSLRRFRNLHPTFSKQVHKIPGTNFAQSSSASSHSGSSYGQANNHNDDGTFKAKMERLQDPNSTNLYIEGLPLSIDEPSLAALVAPHRIKSSRFFQTRLSNPPRIIAFVRLDTRAGAEDVIERLHGRMVRGWNDSGSRISVRFADTSEQRELRRTERVVKEGDQSPARLTIAQAALLNLHGRDQYRSSPQMPPPIGLNRTHPIGMNYDQAGLHSPFRDFSSNAANYHNNEIVLPPAINNFAPSVNSSSYNHAVNDHSLLAGNQELTPAVLALLNSLRGNNGNDDRYSNFQPGPRFRRGLTQSQLQLLNLGGNMGLSDDGLNAPQHPIIGNGVAQARNGFTATEEYILQAHAAGNGSRRRPTRLDLSQAQAQSQGLEHSDFSVGMRGIRTQASAVSLPQLQTRQETYHSPRMMGSSLPALQEEFQTSTTPSHQNGLRGHLFNRNTSNGNGATRLPGERDAGQIPSHGSSFPAQTTSHGSSQTSSNRNTHLNQQAHIRSSTLPPHSTSASTNQTSRHYQHSSMSIPKSRNIASDVMRTTTQRPQQHRTNNSISSIASIGENNMYSDHKYSSDNGVGRHHHGHNQKEGEKQNFDVYSHGFPEQDYEVDQSSPPLVSPALTYSSRGSAATLSPATPFIGSFSNQQGVTADGS